jgi:hypothetical protein
MSTIAQLGPLLKILFLAHFVRVSMQGTSSSATVRKRSRQLTRFHQRTAPHTDIGLRGSCACANSALCNLPELIAPTSHREKKETLGDQWVHRWLYGQARLGELM